MKSLIYNSKMCLLFLVLDVHHKQNCKQNKLEYDLYYPIIFEMYCLKFVVRKEIHHFERKLISLSSEEY